MSGEDANDVTKALAAFGAPSIRYHSFGQSQVKPSSVVLPRRESVPPPPLQTLGHVPAPAPLLRQNEPDAAPEPHAGAMKLAPMPAPLPPSSSPMPPVPAFRRAIDPAAMLSRPAPMPPPRPLSERPISSLIQSAAFTSPAPNPNAPPPVAAFAPTGFPASAPPPMTVVTPTSAAMPTQAFSSMEPAPRPPSETVASTIISRPTPPAAPVAAKPDRSAFVEPSVNPAAVQTSKFRNLRDIFAMLATAP
jgi:hypothetical protein